MTQEDKKQECKKCGRVFGSVKCFDVDCPNNRQKIKQIMSQEQKELLLKDLSSRFPYGVKIHAKFIDTDTNTEVEKVGVLSMIDSDTVVAFTSDDTNCYIYVTIHEVKPYLFPMSNMTEEQKIIYGDLCYDVINSLAWDKQAPLNELIDWLNKNHFDYRGLIEKGLAIDATGQALQLMQQDKMHINMMQIECYDCHEVINFTEDDIIDGWYVKCPCCGEEVSILP